MAVDAKQRVIVACRGDKADGAAWPTPAWDAALAASPRVWDYAISLD